MKELVLVLVVPLVGCVGSYRPVRQSFVDVEAIRALPRNTAPMSGLPATQPLAYPEPVRHVAYGMTAGEVAAVLAMETPLSQADKRYKAIGYYVPTGGPNPPRVAVLGDWPGGTWWISPMQTMDCASSDWRAPR